MTDAGHKRLLGVWLLGLGETVIWAYIFYIFAGLLLTWEETLGWQKADLTLGPVSYTHLTLPTKRIV